MTESSYKTLVRRLRLDGVILEADLDCVHVDSPKGVITPEIQETLHEMKSDLLVALSLEQQVLEMSLGDFAQQGCAIEVKVEWLEDTLWFVPCPEQVQALLNEGVPRGRIWTSRELADLMSVSGMPRRDLVNIAKLKAAFGIEIVSVEGVTEPAG